MSYRKIAEMAADVDLNNRAAACAATRGVDEPVGWVLPRSWRFAATEGWAQAYAESTDDRPGLDEDAVTDAMILAAVTAALEEQEAQHGNE